MKNLIYSTTLAALGVLMTAPPVLSQLIEIPPEIPPIMPGSAVNQTIDFTARVDNFCIFSNAKVGTLEHSYTPGLYLLEAEQDVGVPASVELSCNQPTKLFVTPLQGGNPLASLLLSGLTGAGDVVAPFVSISSEDYDILYALEPNPGVEIETFMGDQKLLVGAQLGFFDYIPSGEYSFTTTITAVPE